jgi:D-3-phosphoglycerate dehydrogenase / 2-oxoglutarate reductase
MDCMAKVSPPIRSFSRPGGRAVSSFRVVVTDPLVPSVEAERQIIEAAGGELEVAGGDDAAVINAVRDADALLNTYFPLGAEVIEQLGRCQIVARYGIGVDNVDLTAASRKGIAVTNVPDYCVEEVAAHALALALGLVRRIKPADALVTAGSWGADKLGAVHRFSTRTVGLVGYGRIARRLSELLAPFGCEVLVADPYVSAVSNGCRLVGLEELLEASDIVSLHCPLTDETRNMMNAPMIARMRDGAVLINVARGGLVVTPDVLAALRAGKLSGAGLDTFDREPPDPAALAGISNLITTPHSGYYSVEAVDESKRKAATQIAKLFRGEPLDYRVN